MFVRVKGLFRQETLPLPDVIYGCTCTVKHTFVMFLLLLCMSPHLSVFTHVPIQHACDIHNF